MIKIGDVISYIDMCREEGVNLQRGMNYRLRSDNSVILMSVRPGAPYADKIEDDGNILIYEGHDQPNRRNGKDPKTMDQSDRNPGGSLTQNGLYKRAALEFQQSKREPEIVKVYEKIRSGIWTYNGPFKLIDAWQQAINGRSVFKFKLQIFNNLQLEEKKPLQDLDHNRLIPTDIKRKVWERDKGQCITCGSKDNLHFDHIIPFSKGGSSLVRENIQLLCARHNLEKRDHIK